MRPIDADKLKERFIGDFGADNLLLNAILEFIDDEDAVEPVPQGEWEERIVECDNPFFRRRFYCSACGDWNAYGMTRYCPDCGAQMKVGE